MRKPCIKSRNMNVILDSSLSDHYLSRKYSLHAVYLMKKATERFYFKFKELKFKLLIMQWFHLCRPTDEPVNSRPNVFTSILQPSPGSKSHKGLQVEMNLCSGPDRTHFTCLLNNMRLMCIFDFLLAMREFISKEPPDPFKGDTMLMKAVFHNLFMSIRKRTCLFQISGVQSLWHELVDCLEEEEEA